MSRGWLCLGVLWLASLSCYVAPHQLPLETPAGEPLELFALKSNSGTPCDPIAALREHPGYKRAKLYQGLFAAGTEVGCLVTIWEHRAREPDQGDFGVLVSVSEGGTLKKLDEADSKRVFLPLPTGQQRSGLKARLYFIRPSKLPPQEPADAYLSILGSLCQKMQRPEFQCFASDSCGFYIEFTLEAEPSCRLCGQEICDGRDNNCSGTIDLADPALSDAAHPLYPYCDKTGAACPGLRKSCGGASGWTPCSPAQLSDRASCNGACVALDSDPNHCGGCNKACKQGERCIKGSCTLTCPDGQVKCGDKCFDLQTSPLHCGACEVACGVGKVCSLGRCETQCGVSLVKCQDSCVDLRKDRDHCGSCDNRCLTAEKCIAGKCQCDAGLSLCQGDCVDLSSNTKHCGSCDAACSPSELCKESRCTCPSGLAPCNGACVNVATDNANCGACGRRCPPGFLCSARRCICTPGLSPCGGACVNLALDPANCGFCANFCTGGRKCSNGKCICSGNKDFCHSSNSCVNHQNDKRHCGRCNRRCTAPTPTCRNGKCQ